MDDQGKEREVRVTIIDVTLKGLCIYKDGSYVINKVKGVMIKMDNNTFLTHHKDKYEIEDRIFQFLRVDRKNNTVVYKEV